MSVARRWARWSFVAVFAVSVEASVWAGELTRGALCREDVVWVEILGRWRAVGRLLEVENGLLLIAERKKTRRVPISSVTRVWREDSFRRRGNKEAGRVAGAGAAVLGAVALPVDSEDYWRAQQHEGKNAAARRLAEDYAWTQAHGGQSDAGPAVRDALVGTAVWAISSAAGRGGRSWRWTEVDVSELRMLDAKATVEELAVDEEQLRATQPATETDKSVLRDDATPTPSPQPTPQDREDGSHMQ